MHSEHMRQKLTLMYNLLLRPKRVFNLMVKEIETLLGCDRLHYYPSALTIDVGNVCNLKCPLCPTGRGDKGVERGFMPFEQFQRILSEVGPYLTDLDLHNWGEPLLNKDLVAMVRLAKKKGITVNISSNLMRLDEQSAEALIAAKIEKIFISLDAASPETYKIYRVGGDFDTVIEHIRLLLAAKKKLNLYYTRLKILFHVFRHNEHEVEKIKQLSKELGVELAINMIRPDMGKEIFDDVKQAIERDGKWLPENSEYCPFDMVSQEKKIVRSCRALWKTAVINWNGNVFPCCSVFGDQYQFGNVFTESFRTIWNNEHYIAARKEVKGRIENSSTICHICRRTGYLHF
ncbi:radical SAM/SPASM domain-containing protein [Desulfobacter sp.]|uniref:radical SAM protein n=1 Tax=Desulfobacter sp. TaxID=2294 RepID=UPI003D0C6B5E